MLWENLGEKLYEIGVSNDILNIITKPQAITAKMDKLNHSRL